MPTYFSYYHLYNRLVRNWERSTSRLSIFTLLKSCVSYRNFMFIVTQITIFSENHMLLIFITFIVDYIWSISLRCLSSIPLRLESDFNMPLKKKKVSQMISFQSWLVFCTCVYLPVQFYSKMKQGVSWWSGGEYSALPLLCGWLLFSC